MLQSLAGFLVETPCETIAEFGTAVQDTAPKMLTAVVFLALAYVGIKAILFAVRGVLDGLYPEEQDFVVELGVVVVGVFLWFDAVLALLNIVGMTETAASLGIATGFIALGVSYALSDMITDTVAGVYLFRNPDFNPGDHVKSDPVTGMVSSIELRKTHFESDEGDTVVVANRDVEEKWTKYGASAAEDASTADATQAMNSAELPAPESFYGARAYSRRTPMGIGSDMYRQQIMDHYKDPRNYGRLESPTLTRTGENPSCGDTITMDVQLTDDGEIIERVTFSGDGCAISQASASMPTQRLPGTTLSELEATNTDDITEMLGVDISPMRIKCAIFARQVAQGGAKIHDGEIEIKKTKTEDGND